MSKAEETTKQADNAKKEKCCCPEFDPSRLDEKEFMWKEKPFVKDSTWCLFYVPLNFGGMTNRVFAKLEAVDAIPADKDNIILSDMTSRWSVRSLFSSTKDNVPGAEMVKLTGTYLAKVFEGHYKNMHSWCEEMKDYVKNKTGKDVDPKTMYAYYATCPGCAKKYGKNYVTFFAKVDD